MELWVEWLPGRIMDWEKVSNDHFYPGSGTILPSSFILIIVLCNYWKERGRESTADEVAPSDSRLVIDTVSIWEVLVCIIWLGCIYTCRISLGNLWLFFLVLGEKGFDPKSVRSNLDVVFFYPCLWILKKMIIWSIDVEDVLTVKATVVMCELHLPCW